MKALILAAVLALAGCTIEPPASPSAVAVTTKLDEQAAVSTELAYKAARLALETAIDTGLLKGARATQAAALDNRAYAAVQAVRSAYRAGNAADYLKAAQEAQAAISGLLSVIKGA